MRSPKKNIQMTHMKDWQKTGANARQMRDGLFDYISVCLHCDFAFQHHH